jgi:hypothetical protein
MAEFTNCDWWDGCEPSAGIDDWDAWWLEEVDAYNVADEGHKILTGEFLSEINILEKEFNDLARVVSRPTIDTPLVERFHLEHYKTRLVYTLETVSDLFCGRDPDDEDTTYEEQENFEWLYSDLHTLAYSSQPPSFLKITMREVDGLDERYWPRTATISKENLISILKSRIETAGEFYSWLTDTPLPTTSIEQQKLISQQHEQIQTLEAQLEQARLEAKQEQPAAPDQQKELDRLNALVNGLQHQLADHPPQSADKEEQVPSASMPVWGKIILQLLNETGHIAVTGDGLYTLDLDSVSTNLFHDIKELYGEKDAPKKSAPILAALSKIQRYLPAED